MRGDRFYLMENPREGERLEGKTIAAAVERQLRWAGLTEGMHALEVGCATGAATRAMARLAVPGRAVGVDQSAVRLDEGRTLAAREGLEIRFVEGEATRLPLPAASFDFAFSRFLFEYLPDPPRALSELIRVTRPGGIVAVADLDGQIESFHPLELSLRASLEEGLRLLGETGFDTRVGRKLYSWFHERGLRDLAVDVSPYQVYAGGIPEREWFNWKTKIATSVEVIIQRAGERTRWERWRDALLEAMRAPGLFYYSTMVVVRGRVP